MDDVIKRAVEAGARAVCELRIRTVRRWDTAPEKLEAMLPAAIDYNWRDSSADAEAAIRAAMPVIGEEVLGVMMKKAWEIGADAATADALVRALRARLKEMEG